MLRWIRDNYQWLFSGIGGAIVLGVIRAGVNRWREARLAAGTNGPSHTRLRTPPLRSRLPGFLLKTVYKPDDVRPRIKIALRDNAPGGASFGGQLPCVDLYFQITNLSPVDLILDRMLVDVWYGQPTLTALLLHRYSVPAGEITDGIHVRHILADNQKAHIQAFKSSQGMSGQLHIYITAYFESKLGRFFVQESIDRNDL